MKQKQLEILLQHVPPPIRPKIHLEQYMTPATIAADIIYLAHHYNDIAEKIVLDLGCGTGIFAVGATLTGAKKIYGIDSDKDSITQATTYAEEHHLPIDYLCMPIEQVTIPCDTILMNPPFGAQKSNLNADRLFLEKACTLAPVIYSMHLTETIPFIEKLIIALHGTITYHKDYNFPIRRTYDFHTKPIQYYPIQLLRITTK
jgi:putative methylase